MKKGHSRKGMCIINISRSEQKLLQVHQFQISEVGGEGGKGVFGFPFEWHVCIGIYIYIVI